MNKRIRYIFWLMTACILAINAFQGYWLWKTYELNRQQIGRSVQDALFNILERRRFAEGRMQVDSGGRQEILIRRFDVAEDSGLRVFFNTEEKSAVGPAPDSLEMRVPVRVEQDWDTGGQLDLEKFGAAYKEELRRRGIDFAFRLDTLTLLPKSAAGNVLYFNSSMVLSGKGGELQTMPLMLQPGRHLFVRASFPSTTPYLLKQMGWLLGSSMLLLILTTGCFLFMLRTILRQKKLSEIKNSFINNMTHELKTPIATVTAAVDAMRNFGALEDRQKTDAYLEISHNNLQRLSELVEKVLNLAVEEKSGLVLQRERVNLAGLVNSLVADHRLRSVKPVSFDVEIPAGVVVEVDPLHFGNALNNLLDNAINYSYEQVRVDVRYSEDVKGWRLSVSDNGIGIPRAYLSAVFEKFFRVPTGDLHAVRGFGLGLAYVKQVVELHGGSISVRSEQGKGSEFIVAF